MKILKNCFVFLLIIAFYSVDNSIWAMEKKLKEYQVAACPPIEKSNKEAKTEFTNLIGSDLIVKIIAGSNSNSCVIMPDLIHILKDSKFNISQEYFYLPNLKSFDLNVSNMKFPLRIIFWDITKLPENYFNKNTKVIMTNIMDEKLAVGDFNAEDLMRLVFYGAHVYISILDNKLKFSNVPMELLKLLTTKSQIQLGRQKDDKKNIVGRERVMSSGEEIKAKKNIEQEELKKEEPKDKRKTIIGVVRDFFTKETDLPESDPETLKKIEDEEKIQRKKETKKLSLEKKEVKKDEAKEIEFRKELERLKKIRDEQVSQEHEYANVPKEKVQELKEKGLLPEEHEYANLPENIARLYNQNIASQDSSEKGSLMFKNREIKPKFTLKTLNESIKEKQQLKTESGSSLSKELLSIPPQKISESKIGISQYENIDELPVFYEFSSSENEYGKVPLNIRNESKEKIPKKTDITLDSTVPARKLSEVETQRKESQ